MRDDIGAKSGFSLFMKYRLALKVYFVRH